MELYEIGGRNASDIAAALEAAIRDGRLEPGAQVPTIRALAAALRISPATAAAAYRALRVRGLLAGDGRRGSRVTGRPPVGARAIPHVPPDARNLAAGNPDARLLPALGPALERAAGQARLYGEPAADPRLLALAARQLGADGIPTGALAVVGGALDGIERALAAHLRPGDRVLVEDPGYPGVLDLVAALGLVVEPVAIDDAGMQPDALARALTRRPAACIVTPRAQNPTGAALDTRRAQALVRVLRAHPDVLLLEDDHAGPIAGAAAVTLCAQGRQRWAVVRSVSKSLGPDLRLAVMAGDPVTIARIEGRQMLGTGWVSHLLQNIVVALWSDPETRRIVRRAEAQYATRRTSLLQALARHGVAAHGRSGLNVWIPVREELAVVQSLVAAGWAVSAGERFRVRSAPAIRITIATLQLNEIERLAADVARSVAPASPSYVP